MRTTRAPARDRTNRTRKNELKTMLEHRYRSLVHDVHGRIRDTRTDSLMGREVLDEGESSEVDTQGDIELALMEMKADTLNKIDAALRRIEEGTYDCCFECGGEIAEARLRALPFAVRCRGCEELHEAADQRGRSLARRASSALFLDPQS